MTREQQMLLNVCKLYLAVAAIIALLLLPSYVLRDHKLCIDRALKLRQENKKLEKEVTNIRERRGN